MGKLFKEVSRCRVEIEKLVEMRILYDYILRYFTSVYILNEADCVKFEAKKMAFGGHFLREIFRDGCK